MEKIVKDEYGYLYRGNVMETLQEAENVRYIVEKFEDYPQKTKLTTKVYESLILLKAFEITDRDMIYKTIKENKEKLWNIF